MNLADILIIKNNNSEKKLQCKECPYYNCKFVPSYIADNSVAIIGEAPGETEAEKGVPFVGKSGTLLRELLSEVGFDVSKITFLNTVKCRPPNNETPHKDAQKLCVKLFLKSEILQLRPKVIVPAGAVSLETFFPKSSIMDKAGAILKDDLYTYLPIIHPAACLYVPERKSKLRKDLKHIYQFVNGELTESRQYVIVKTQKELEEAKQILLKSNLLSFDTETNKIKEVGDVFDPDLSLWTFGFGYDKYKAFSIPLNHPEVEDIQFRENCWAVVREIANSDCRKIAHNSIFDLKMCRKFNIPLRNFYADTKVMAFLLNENRYSFKLKDLASEYLDSPMYDWSEKLNELGLHNCEDCDNALGIFELSLKDFKKYPKLWNLLQVVLTPMSWVVVDMELAGINLNTKVSEQLSKKLHHKLDAIRETINELVPEAKEVNFSSPKQLSDLMLKLKYPLHKKTDSNQYSTDEEVLTELSDKGYKLSTYLLKIRKHEKALSTYIEKLPRIIKSDGRIHGSFNLTGARTGRTASSDPNMQNIPARDKSIKKMFTALEGWILLNADMCIRRGTKIALLEGDIPIEQVVERVKKGEYPFVYCFQFDKQRIGLGKVIDGGLTRSKTALVRVTLDNNEFVDVTPEHKFMLRTGEYVEAQKLVIGDSLMPLYRKLKVQRWGTYRKINVLNGRGHSRWMDEQDIVLEDVIGIVHKKGSGMCVHHKNRNGCDNKPENLMYISRGEHMRIHGIIGKETYRKNKLEGRPHWTQTPQGREKLRHQALKWWSTAPDFEKSKRVREMIITVNRLGCNKGVNNGHYGYKHSDQFKCEQSLRRRTKYYPIVIDKIKIDHKYYTREQALLFPKGKLSRFQLKKLYPNEIKRKEGILNHKVVKLEFLTEVDDTYNITVEKYHNFATAAGVIVKNSQAELRVACSIADERNMIQAYLKGIDVHKLTGSAVLHIPMEEVTEEKRQKAKSVNFGFIYGASPEGFQRIAKNEYGLTLSSETCAIFRREYFKLYPGFLPWYMSVQDSLRKYGYVEYPTGRFRRFPQVKGLREIPDDILKQAVNAPVQGSSSDIVLFVMVKLREILSKYKMLNVVKLIVTVHDNMLFEIQPKEVDVVRCEIEAICKKYIPRQFPWLKVPILFDYASGVNWSEMDKIKT